MRNIITPLIDNCKTSGERDDWQDIQDQDIHDKDQDTQDTHDTQDRDHAT
jgi:hypothetical protein